MKDIKSEILGNFNDEMLEKQTKIQLLGENQTIPKSVFLSQIKNLNIYEIDDISEIIKHRKELLKKVRVSFKVFFWMIKLHRKFNKSKIYKEYTKLYKEYGHIEREIEGNNTTILDMLFLRIQKKTLFYIVNVQLRNFRKISCPLVSAYEFDIIDSKNNTIRGVIKYDAFFDSILSKRDPDILQDKSILETARSSEPGHHYMVTGMLLDTEYLDENFKRKVRKTKILVTRISDGGYSQKLSVPLIKF